VYTFALGEMSGFGVGCAGFWARFWGGFGVGFGLVFRKCPKKRFRKSLLSNEIKK
jgi:hypothetical protein